MTQQLRDLSDVKIKYLLIQTKARSRISNTHAWVIHALNVHFLWCFIDFHITCNVQYSNDADHMFEILKNRFCQRIGSILIWFGRIQRKHRHNKPKVKNSFSSVIHFLPVGTLERWTSPCSVSPIPRTFRVFNLLSKSPVLCFLSSKKCFN